jgi:FixJ family two-component response regulator
MNSSNVPNNDTPIVLVDDDFITLDIMNNILIKSNFKTKAFNNPLDALDFIRNNDSFVLITDLNMPLMDGDQLILETIALYPKAVVVVISSSNDIPRASKLIAQGIYDYILKPINPKDLFFLVNKALELHNYRRNESITSLKEKIEIANEMNWSLWKESILKNSNTKNDKDLIGNLSAGLIQGSGIGSIVSITTLIESASEIKDDYYMVHKDIMLLLFESAKNASRTINILNEIEHLNKDSIEKKDFNVIDLQEIIQFQADHYFFIATGKQKKIQIFKNRDDFNRYKISLNLEYFMKAIDEILINALKFSKVNSTIFILYEIDELKKQFKLIFLNSPDLTSEEIHQIQRDYQTSIFEPFIRYSKHSYSEYKTLDIGLGLTIVKNIIENHNGEIHMSTIKNHINPIVSEKLFSLTINLALV